MHARAATLVQPGRYEVREYPVAEPGPGAALIKNELSGICGTDKHTYQGFTTQYAGAPSASSTPFPIIQGHENVGTIEAVSGDVRDFEGEPLGVGDRVILGPNVTCKQCHACTHGFPRRKGRAGRPSAEWRRNPPRQRRPRSTRTWTPPLEMKAEWPGTLVPRWMAPCYL